MKKLEKILKLVRENPKIVFLQDVYQSIGMSSSTFYRQFPKDSEAYNEIVEALEANKTVIKRDIRDRLANCKSPVGLIVLYRLLGSTEERKALNQKDDEVKSSEQEITLKVE